MENEAMKLTTKLSSRLLVGLLGLSGSFSTVYAAQVLTGQEAFTDYSKESPGLRRKITPADLPKPFSTESADNRAQIVKRPENTWPECPPGFKVELYASKLSNPRLIRVAPNGDLFLAESAPGRIKVFRGIASDGTASKSNVFASGLRQPFGIAFYPIGPNPKWLYVANTDSVVRYPYKNGDIDASAPPEEIIKDIQQGAEND